MPWNPGELTLDFAALHPGYARWRRSWQAATIRPAKTPLKSAPNTMSNNTLCAEVRFSSKGETLALEATYNPIRMDTLGG